VLKGRDLSKDDDFLFQKQTIDSAFSLFRFIVRFPQLQKIYLCLANVPNEALMEAEDVLSMLPFVADRFGIYCFLTDGNKNDA
jgi:hypothetical protein